MGVRYVIGRNNTFTGYIDKINVPISMRGD